MTVVAHVRSGFLISATLVGAFVIAVIAIVWSQPDVPRAHTKDDGNSSMMDCFVDPPNLASDVGREGERGWVPDETEESAIESYLAEFPESSGTFYPISGGRWAVAFTKDGCLHQQALSARLHVPTTNVVVYRVDHPQEELEKIANLVTQHVNSTLKELNLVSWSAGDRGAVDVRVFVPTDVQRARRILASLFTGGDESYFIVRSTNTRAAPA